MVLPKTLSQIELSVPYNKANGHQATLVFKKYLFRQCHLSICHNKLKSLCLNKLNLSKCFWQCHCHKSLYCDLFRQCYCHKSICHFPPLPLFRQCHCHKSICHFFSFYFGITIFFKEMICPQYFHNIFTKNPKW